MWLDPLPNHVTCGPFKLLVDLVHFGLDAYIAVWQWDRISGAVAADRRSDAVKLFLKLVGVPGFVRALMPLMLPIWSKLKAVAHTLPYDGAVVRDNQRGKPLPASQWASVTIPALVMYGGNSPAWMRHANQSLASVLPNARYRTLQGQTHMLRPKTHAPILVEFFKD